MPSALIQPSSAYNIGEYLEIRGSIEAKLFERALRQVVNETEALHVHITEHAGDPRQVIGNPPAWSMPFIDVSAETDARAAAESWMQADLARPIEPTLGPLFGYALFKASDDRFFWYARYHHIIMDGFGMWLVARRLAHVYTQLSIGRSTHDGLPGALAGLLEEDAAYRKSELFARDRQYWLDHLADRPDPVGIGGGGPSPSGTSLRHTVYPQHATVDRLRSIARQAGTGLSQVMAAATAIFLHRLTAANDLIFGLPVAARNNALRTIPGMVSNVVPLRLAVHPSMTVSEVIGQTARQMRRGLRHQRYPIADLRRDIGIVDGRPLFGPNINIMEFNYDFRFAGNHATAHNLSIGPVEDLSISVYDRSDGASLRIDFDANPALHAAAEVADHQQKFLTLLAAIADSGRTIGSLDILTPAERHTILRDWNGTAAAIAPATLPELFAAQVVKNS